jgi:hypothetical protein
VIWLTGATNTHIEDYSICEQLPSTMTTPVPVTFKPQKGTFSAMWWNGEQSSEAVFSIASPVGSISVLDIEFTLANNIAGVAITSVATAVLGSAYYLPLDGRSANQYAHIGLPSTV